MVPDPARELFESLTNPADDPTNILNLIGQQEDLYLECKTIKHGDQIRRHNSDTFFNFGKSISAFANAEGGVIVWGLTTENNSTDVPDEINGEVPILDVKKVKSDLDAILGRVVIRPVVGVQNRIIYSDESGNNGFIITYVPKSDESPHRVAAKNSNNKFYYRRHGNCSLPLEHYELEEMFSGRARPKLSIIFSAKPAGVSSYYVNFGLKNIGRTIAKYPYLAILNANASLAGAEKAGLPYIINGSNQTYIGGSNDVIHIGCDFWIHRFKVNVEPNFREEGKSKNLKFHFRIACEKVPVRDVEISFDLSEIVGEKIRHFDSN